MEGNENRNSSIEKSGDVDSRNVKVASGSGSSENCDTDWTVQVRHLEAENRKMQSEFNTQRAKMKEFYVQKEHELDELKTKFVVAEMKAQEEISSLQQLVQDTIEESTICKAELERFKKENNILLFENRQLRDELVNHLHQQSQSQSAQPQSAELTSLAPQVLSQVKKTLVRKLGGESAGAVLGGSFSQEAADEAASRNKSVGRQYAHEDSEVLGSIVTQLQEEMKALKEKLREADEKLQTSNVSNPMSCGEPSKDAEQGVDNSVLQSNRTNETSCTPCVACSNYEDKIRELLAKATEDRERINTLQKQLEESSKDLQKEAALRADLEDQWQQNREVHKTEVHLLREQVKLNEQQLLEMQQKFLEAKDEITRQLQRVTDERESVNKHLETLQADNDFLSGRYLATAEEIENQYINLPNSVEELQEIILRQRNELIQARLGCDFERKRCVTSLDEIQILRDQLEASNNERSTYKKKFQMEIKSLESRLKEHLLTLQNYETTKTALERKEAELNRQISEFRVYIIELQEKNEKLSKINTDYKAKIKNLQEDLVTSEQVQKDFVTLSQTLQMTLEQLRNADSEVRWQDEDDIANCPKCNVYFTVTVRKTHCRHCGRIFCDKCLTKTVASGPRQRLARVCDICHTLLTPNTAPYFSHEHQQHQQQQQQQQQQQEQQQQQQQYQQQQQQSATSTSPT